MTQRLSPSDMSSLLAERGAIHVHVGATSLLEGGPPELGGRHACVSKTHHALVDGVSAVDVGTIMLDPNPEGTEMPLPEERWDPDEPSAEMLFVRAATDRIRTPLRAARSAARGALSMPRE